MTTLEPSRFGFDDFSHKTNFPVACRVRERLRLTYGSSPMEDLF